MAPNKFLPIDGYPETVRATTVGALTERAREGWMRIPGIWAPTPEVIASLWSGAGAGSCPFRSLQGGLDVWEASMSQDVSVLSKLGLERLEADLPEAPVVVGEGDWFVAMEGVPRSQRLTAALREWQWRYEALVAGIRESETEVGGISPAVRQAVLLASGVLVRAFQAVPTDQLGALWGGVSRQVERPLVMWAWSCGVVRRVWGSGGVTPERVLSVLKVWVGECEETLFEVLLIVRVMHGAPTVAGHVMGRWLMQQVWGQRGLWDVLPEVDSSLWVLLPEAWVLEGDVRKDVSSMSVGVVSDDGNRLASGVGLSMAALLDRYERLVVMEPGLQEVLLADVDEAVSDAPGWTKKMRAWCDAEQKARRVLDAKEDASGRLGFDPYRTLLMVVTPELATGAAELVLRWRHHFFQRRLMEEPRGFVSSVEGWMAQVIARMEGLLTTSRVLRLDQDAAFWFGYSSGVAYAAELPDRRRLDWRIEEILRPLIYAALSSMASGLHVPNAEQLYKHCAWVGTKIWRPTWASIPIYRALEVLFALSPKGIEPEVFGVWASELGVEESELAAWLEVQPFDLAQLERFRLLVAAGDVELGLVGSLPETLYARPHLKPSWLTGPLLGLVEPRQVRDPLG